MTHLVVAKLLRAVEGIPAGDLVVGRVLTRTDASMGALRISRPRHSLAFVRSEHYVIVDAAPKLDKSRCRGCVCLRYTVWTRCPRCGSSQTAKDNPGARKTGGVL